MSPSVSRATEVAQVGDVALAWDEHGGAGGRPLVLVHGFTGSRDDWADVIDSLATLGRTVTYDQRGHGVSSKPDRSEDYSVEHLVADLAGLLDALGIESCDLLGHSLGGAVALRFAIEFPGRVTSLILMDTSAGPPEELKGELLAATELVRVNGMGWFAEQVAAAPLDGDAAKLAARDGEEECRQRLRWQLGAVSPIAFTTLAPLLVGSPSIADQLSCVACPTTVIVGADDLPFLHPARELVDGIPGARQVVIDGAAHSPQKAEPDAWLTAVTDHLNSCR